MYDYIRAYLNLQKKKKKKKKNHAYNTALNFND